MKKEVSTYLEIRDFVGDTGIVLGKFSLKERYSTKNKSCITALIFIPPFRIDHQLLRLKTLLN